MPVIAPFDRAFADTRPAMEADPGFVVPYLKGFINGCLETSHGDPRVRQMACACGAAVVADRFTIDELLEIKAGGGIAASDKLHTETSRLVGVCARGAKATEEQE